MNRLLMIHHEGAPRAFYATAGEVREALARFESVDADLLQVWAVYHDALQPAHEVTEEYSSEIDALRPAGADDRVLELARAS